MKQRMFNRVVLASLFALGLPSLALGAAPSQYHHDGITVSYADLNIESEAGARVLYARLQQASERICEARSYRELGSLRRVSLAKECVEAKVSKAVRNIDSETLTKIHTG